MVPPERETPGNQGHGLGKAVKDAVLVGQLGQVAFLLADGVRDGQDQAEHDQGGGDNPEAAQHGFDLVLEQQAQDDDRQAAQDHQPAHPGVRVLPGDFARPGTRTRP